MMEIAPGITLHLPGEADQRMQQSEVLPSLSLTMLTKHVSESEPLEAVLERAKVREAALI